MEKIDPHLRTVLWNVVRWYDSKKTVAQRDPMFSRKERQLMLAIGKLPKDVLEGLRRP